VRANYILTMLFQTRQKSSCLVFRRVRRVYVGVSVTGYNAAIGEIGRYYFFFVYKWLLGQIK